MPALLRPKMIWPEIGKKIIRYGTNLTFPISEYKKCNQTSGTRGRPMTWMDTIEDWRWMLGNWDRVLEAAGVQSGKSLLFCFLVWPILRFLDRL